MSDWSPEKAQKRKERRHQRKQRFLQMLGGKCAHCGSVENLEFDHIDPNNKQFKITKFIDLSDNNLLLEVGKCQLLCDKCHQKKTFENQEYGEVSDHGTIWRYKKYKCRCPLCQEAMNNYNRKTNSKS